MPNLKAYQKHVKLYGHEAVMATASADPHMSDDDVKKLGLFIAQTAKSSLTDKKGKRK